MSVKVSVSLPGDGVAYLETMWSNRSGAIYAVIEKACPLELNAR